MELKEIIEKMDRLKEQLDALRPMKEEYLYRLNQKLRLDLNYHSNSIEGNTLSMSETKSFIFWGLTAKGKPFRDYVEMKGHNEAIKKLYDIVHQDLKITESLIKDFHKLILVEPHADPLAEINPGEWKKGRNYLYSPVGERIDFADPAEVPTLMSALINWTNNHIAPPKRKKKKYDIHPLLIAAGFHTQFIKIHPFGDGNGRMSRIFTNLILMLCGYVPAVVLQEKRDEYYNAINTSSLDNPEDLATYLGEAVINSLELAIKAAKGESIEDPDDFDKELALLDQKLKGEGEVIEKIKDEATLRAFGKTTLVQLVSAFMKMQRKFERFYVKSNSCIEYYKPDDSFDGDGYPFFCEEVLIQENLIDLLDKAIVNSLDLLLVEDKEIYNCIVLRHKFEAFNRDKTNPFDYTTSVGIDFNKAEFVVTIENEEKFKFLYTKTFTEEELENLLKIGAKSHLKYIQEYPILPF